MPATPGISDAYAERIRERLLRCLELLRERCELSKVG